MSDELTYTHDQGPPAEIQRIIPATELRDAAEDLRERADALAGTEPLPGAPEPLRDAFLRTESTSPV